MDKWQIFFHGKPHYSDTDIIVQRHRRQTVDLAHQILLVMAKNQTSPMHGYGPEKIVDMAFKIAKTFTETADNFCWISDEQT